MGPRRNGTLAGASAVAGGCYCGAERIADEYGSGAEWAAESLHMKKARATRVLQVIDSLGMGGAETWLIELLRFWSKTEAVQMDFLATGGKTGIFDDEARRLGAKVHYIRYARSHLPAFARQFRRVLCDGQYDAIHDHQDYTSGWHFLMGDGELPRVRITHVHNPSYQIRNNYGVTPARRMTARIGKALVARYSTHITGTSRQAIAEYGFDASRFDRIPKAALHCGFQPARFAGEHASAKASVCSEFGWPDDATIILFVGRIDVSVDPAHPQNHKNSAFAVSVGTEAAQRESRVRMLLAGAPSPAVPALEERIAAAGFSDRIRFTGIRKDIERLMLGSDVLLFPSRGEGLGMAAVEAQAAGLPVLASDSVPRECVIVPELVRFQKVEAGEAAWACNLLQLGGVRQNSGEANRCVAESGFSIENSAGALLWLYREGLLSS
jgi:glycosyltransferase involved in cell wall biosynthesis